jgi:hypothetical protein
MLLKIRRLELSPLRRSNNLYQMNTNFVPAFHLLPEMLTRNSDVRFPPPEGALPTEKAYRGFLR